MTDAKPNETHPFALTRLKSSSVGPDSLSDAAFGYRAGEVIERKYELLRLLERGRVTAIWAVQDLVLDAQFALKLLANYGGDPVAIERMLREARAGAALEHPAVARVFDFGVTHRGDPFIVMELLRGETIEQLLRVRERFSPPEAVQLLLPIAEALELAHSHGTIHRAVKPENIVCVEVDFGRVQPKLVDFGVAWSVQHHLAQTGPPGDAFRRPEYLSPEQVADEASVDPRSDIWSFSVMLHEMLTGSSPFHRDTPELSRRAVVEDPAPPLAYDEELSAIVLRGLAKSPDARWPDMGSYGRALAGWLLRHGVEDDATGQSLRVVWLGVSPSAPPVAIDRFPESGVAPRENQHFPGAEDAYVVPTNGVWRTAKGVAGAVLTLAAIAAAGAFAVGAFDKPDSASTQMLAPWTAPEQAGTPVLEPVSAMADPESVSGTARTDAGEPDAGGADTGALDAALDAVGPRVPGRAARARWRAGPPWTWQPEPREPSDPATDLPTPQPPPDLGPAGSEEEPYPEE